MINNNLPNNWKAVDFGDIFNFEKKSKHKASDGKKNGKYMYFTSSNLQSKSADFFDLDGEYLIFGTGGNASIHCPNGRFSTSGDCLVAKIKNTKVLTKYVYRYLTANMYLLEAGFKGAGLKHISKTFIQNIKIPYPENVEVQKKIAAILEKAEQLKEWRKEADRLTDEFLKSTFLEIFGDPVKNPRGWKIVKFGNLWSHYSHGYPGRNNLGNPLGTLILRIRNVRKDKVVYEKLDSEEIALKYIQRYALERGDLLLVRVNGSPVEIGRSVIFQGFDEVVIHDDNIIRIVLDSTSVLPEYIQELLKSRYVRSKIAKTCKTTAGQYLLSKTKLHEIDMPCPPLKFQKRFVNIVKNVETIQQSQIQSQKEIDNLFNALMQQAFKGELAC